METFFRDRRDAGQQLAAKLARYRNSGNPIVLALPRGGVPVAFEIAEVLNAPLDLVLVRKLGVPGQEELAMGAIAAGGMAVLNDEIIRNCSVTRDEIEGVLAAEMRELDRRNRLYRGEAPIPDIRNRTVILVDDGMATGATMQAAAEYCVQREAGKIIVAVPIASGEAVTKLEKRAADIVVLHKPSFFSSVGNAYEDFGQTADSEVKALLEKARNFGKERR